MASKHCRGPLLDDFEGKEQLTSYDFIRIFKEFDRDDNGYIESKELDLFLKKLLEEKYGMNVSKGRIQQWKDYILKNYDTNSDGKLGLKEVASILPTDENALLDFKLGTKISSVEFMKIWNYYDPAKDGFLGEDELRAFCRDLLLKQGNRVTKDAVDDCVECVLSKCDKNRDGTVELSEMAKYVGVEDNFLNEIGLTGKKISSSNFEKIWNHYNQDRSDAIGGPELDALLRDYYTKLDGKEPDMETINRRRDMLMRFVDQEGDEKIQKDELIKLLSYAKRDEIRRL